MSWLQRLRRRVEDGDWLSAIRGRAGGHQGPRPDLTVDTFEYVRVGPAALVRASGSWAARVKGPIELRLRVRTEDGHDHEVAALPETAGVRWKAAFPLAAGLVELPEAAFSLDAPVGQIDLPRPILRGLHADAAAESELGDAPTEREQALGGRVLEAEAGLRWMEDQLRHERTRRRHFEREIQSLEAKNEVLKAELQELSALALEASGLSVGSGVPS